MIQRSKLTRTGMSCDYHLITHLRVLPDGSGEIILNSYYDLACDPVETNVFRPLAGTFTQDKDPYKVSYDWIAQNNQDYAR